VSFAAITVCVASQRVIPKVSVYFVIDSFRKLLDKPTYEGLRNATVVNCIFPKIRLEGLRKND
jgi:hypothetical protein